MQISDWSRHLTGPSGPVVASACVLLRIRAGTSAVCERRQQVRERRGCSIQIKLFCAETDFQPFGSVQTKEPEIRLRWGLGYSRDRNGVSGQTGGRTSLLECCGGGAVRLAGGVCRRGASGAHACGSNGDPCGLFAVRRCAHQCSTGPKPRACPGLTDCYSSRSRAHLRSRDGALHVCPLHPSSARSFCCCLSIVRGG